MIPHLLPLPGNEPLAAALCKQLRAELGSLNARHFPDGESYLRIDSDVAGRTVILVATLDRPDDKTLRVLFAADAARDLGAARVGLIAPYVAYMRQDRRFKPGEAITSVSYARLLSQAFDFLVTIDPHLHRHASMDEIYTIPVGVGHATAAIAAWIKQSVPQPLIIGPDAESQQWVAAVAERAAAPFTVLDKTRRGDRDVVVALGPMEQFKGLHPVLVDDIISSGRTMEVTVRLLLQQGFPAPIVVGVHGLFSGDAFARLQDAGAGRIVSCNSVPHASNAIDLTELISSELTQLLAKHIPSKR